VPVFKSMTIRQTFTYIATLMMGGTGVGIGILSLTAFGTVYQVAFLTWDVAVV
jgi:hypothetical protein